MVEDVVARVAGGFALGDGDAVLIGKGVYFVNKIMRRAGLAA